MTPRAIALCLLLTAACLTGCATPSPSNEAPASSSSGSDGALVASSSPSANAASLAAGSAALGLVVDAPAPTRNATVTLTGALAHAAHVSVGAVAVDSQDGAWSLKVPVAFGETRLLVLADDGASVANATVLAVRLASATFEAKYTMAAPPHPNSSDTVWYDLDHLSSAPMYQGKKTPRGGNYTVHDLMADWTAQTGRAIEYGYSESFGYSVSKIDGVGQPLSASAPPYWCYKLDGDGSDVLGISLQEIQPGDTVTWEFAGCA